MFQTLSIRGFRRFQRFELDGLAKVNLLVGKNDCGKTTILEAIDLLCAQQDDAPLGRMVVRRGETVPTEGRVTTGTPSSAILETRRLFHGDALESGSSFRVTGTRGPKGRARSVIGLVSKAPSRSDDGEQGDAINGDGSEPRKRLLELTWEENGASSTFRLTITARGGISVSCDDSNDQVDLKTPLERIPSRFIDPIAVMPRQIIRMYSNIALTPSEDLIIDTLRIIEPAIERLAVVAPADPGTDILLRGGIVARCTGVEGRVPVGSMGDGVWRILALALALATAEGGVLLVDEIDTGLHHTVMSDMWRALRGAAGRLGVQVFATTHSNDCWTSLAAVAQEESVEPSDVAIHRIEPENERAVRFSRDEMIIAAERGLEVR